MNIYQCGLIVLVLGPMALVALWWLIDTIREMYQNPKEYIYVRLWEISISIWIVMLLGCLVGMLVSH